MITFILSVVLGIAVSRWLVWKLKATVLAAWMAEKNYAPPEKNDCERLKSWIIHKWLGI